MPLGKHLLMVTKILASHRRNAAAPLPPHVWMHLRLYIDFTYKFSSHSALWRWRASTRTSTCSGWITIISHFLWWFSEDFKFLWRTLNIVPSQEYLILEIIKSTRSVTVSLTLDVKDFQREVCWKIPTLKSSWDLFRFLQTARPPRLDTCGQQSGYL